MNYLLDTHAFFWAAFQQEKLSPKVTALLKETGNEVYVSQVSLWEIALKHAVGKLPELKVNLTVVVKEVSRAGFTLLPLKNEHLIAYFNYPHFSESHKDPFDRLLGYCGRGEGGLHYEGRKVRCV